MVFALKLKAKQIERLRFQSVLYTRTGMNPVSTRFVIGENVGVLEIKLLPKSLKEKDFQMNMSL